MALQLKHAAPPPSHGTTDDVARVVAAVIDDVSRRGDEAVREYSQTFDGWSPKSFRLDPDEVERIVTSVDRQAVEDIKAVQANVRHFAQRQRESLMDFEVETMPGVRLGQRSIPVGAAGAYVPGGRYPLVASAHMTVVTAKVAGVPRVVACTPPILGEIPAATITAMHLAGVDEINLLGGVQAIAAMALGTESIRSVDLIAGPATPTSPRPSASCSVASASTCWRARRRSLWSQTTPPTRSSWPSTCSARPSTAPTPRPC